MDTLQKLKFLKCYTAVLRDDFRQNPTDVVVAAGEPAILECVPPRGHPEPTIYWKKDKVRIDDKDDRITIRGGKLMISNTRKSDAGMYICVGTNMVGERDSETAQVTVFERPTFLRRPINQVVLEEETVEFRCQVQGDPQPNVRWRKDDIDVPRGRYEIKYDKDDYVLRVKKASITDEGTFTCVAENRVGKLEASATLTVRARPVAAPQFVIRPRDQIVAQGRTATFPCETKGNPQPAVFWQKEGSQNLLFPNQPQQPNSRFSVSPSGDLTISSVQRADAGYYICQALTVAGSILAKAQLEVTDEKKRGGKELGGGPGALNRPPRISRAHQSQTLRVDSGTIERISSIRRPHRFLSWLKDGVSLLERTPAHVSGELGSLQIKNVRTMMRMSLSPPSKPQVTDVTKNSVSLSWQPGMAGASPVSSFVIDFQGVDHRHVQKELEVIVRLHNPVVLSPTTIQVTLDGLQSSVQADIRAAFTRTLAGAGCEFFLSSVILSALKKGIVYEIKVDLIFNGFKGMDSESRAEARN
ncbi:roundabout homolog 2-like protein [Lates japonicus]|uniref:Roundabout homolog 2-like protein n=1 Tax=Lates japonicus TaxID=270547 RepID=A0AAD3MGG0_LATJO|nr:roundabout homolog 2-like protein [Lates japonicus]